MIFLQIFLFVNVIVLSIITITATIVQNQIDQMSKTDQEAILEFLLTTSSRRDATDNWCCKNDPGVEVTSKTRQTTFYVVKHGRHRCGYDGCGVFGWGRCTRWCSETWSEMQQGVETYLLYTKRVCPNDQITCCAQHIYVLGHCFSYTEINNNQQLLAQLNELGIVIPGPSVG